MDFYERLEELRKAKKISQKDLEIALELSNGSVSKWKKSTPKYETLQKLAKFFNTTVDYLVIGNEIKTDTALTNMDAKLKEYALKLADLPKDKQEQIMNLIDMLEG